MTLETQKIFQHTKKEIEENIFKLEKRLLILRIIAIKMILNTEI